MLSSDVAASVKEADYLAKLLAIVAIGVERNLGMPRELAPGQAEAITYHYRKLGQVLGITPLP